MKTLEKEYFQQLIEKRIKLADALKDDAAIGIWTSVIDKYPDSAHFIYELLQNADDAKASKVYLKLTKEGFIFKHNGSIRFSVSDPTQEKKDREKGTLGHINSITSIGASTKSADNSENKIGKFGVGFKAVFQYTQTPYVYDELFKFKLNDYIVPVPLVKDHKSRLVNETLFYLPFNKEGVNPQRSYQEIEKKLQTLDNPILFLHNLQEIVWETDNNSSKGIYSKHLVSTKSINDISCTLLELKNYKDEKPAKLWLFSRDVKLAEGIFPISVGFYLDENGKKIDTNIRPNIYCFFTTSENLDLCFVMHAPFLLVDNRQQIKRNEDVNFKLLYELAKLAADSILCLRDIGIKNKTYLINDNLLKIIPLNTVNSGDKLSPNIFYEKFLALLKSEKILFTQSKKYLSREYAIWTDTLQIHKLLDTDQLNQLIVSDDSEKENKIGKYDFVFRSYIDKNEDEKQFIKYQLHIEKLDKEEFAEKFSYKFISIQSDEWLIKFYSFLSDSKSLWERVKLNYGNYSDAVLRYKPIIKLNNGEFERPFTGDKPNVFLPSVGVSDSFNIISPVLIQNDIARKFIEELGIKEPDKTDHIRNFILPKYSGENVEIDDDEIVKDFEIIYCQYLDCKTQDSLKYIQEINENLLVVAECNGSINLYKISEVYAVNEALLRYFENNETACFFSMTFYKPIFDLYGEEKVLEFLGILNLRTYPKIIINNPSWWSFPRRKEFKSDYSYSSHIHLNDYEIDGLQNILNKTVGFELSLYLWKNLNEKYRPYFKAQCEYREYRARYLSTDYCESTFIVSLKKSTYGWLYNKENQPKNPIEIYREDLHENYIKNEKTEELYLLLGIESRPRTEDEKIRESLPPEMQEENSFGKDAKNKFGTMERMEKAESLLKQQEEKEAAAEERKRLQLEANRNNPLQKEQTKRSVHDMFDGDPENITPQKNKVQAQNNQIEKLKEKQEEELEERNHIEELRIKTEDLPKYCAEWFSTLLELEYIQSGEERFGNKGITISFSKVERESEESRIFVLRNPSRYIPTSLEEIGGLEITFKFKDADDLTIGFEVANVREYTLRVKAKLADEALLNLINFQSLSRAIVSTNNPVQLIEKLRISFNALKLENSFCLKQNLPDNIHFIFGPPGTGKTTTLVKKWINAKVANKPKVKMLILTPTNKACDVLLEKAINLVDKRSNPTDWLFRFVATSNESLENYVCERSLDIREIKKLCLISTIARFPYDGFQDTNYSLKLKDVDWDYIIIDESSMIPLAQIIFAIYQCPKSQFIIAGDPFQIEPIVKEPIWVDENIYTMVNLNSFTLPILEPKPFVVENLETQYRSLPAIGEIFSEYSYDGKLNHFRNRESMRPLKLNNLDIKTINYITFKVERFDSIFGIKKTVFLERPYLFGIAYF